MSEKIYYTLPFRFESFDKKTPLEKVGLKVSIQQNLRFLLGSALGKCRAEPSMGSKIQGHQFSLSNKTMIGKKDEADFMVKLEENITTIIRRYEPRLSLKNVSVQLKTPKYERRPLNFDGQMFQHDTLQLAITIRGGIKANFGQEDPLSMEESITLI